MTASPAPAKPRVAMLISGDLFGGAERMLLTLCKALESTVDTVVFQTLPGPFTKAAEAAGVRVRRVIEGKSVALSARLLAQIIIAERIDLLHTHGYRGAAIAAATIAHGRRLPVVHTQHGAPEQMHSVRAIVYEMLGRLSSLYSRSTRIYVSEELRRKMGAPASAPVIYNGVDIPTTRGPRPAALPVLESSQANLVAVGRLEPVKGLSYLIAAMGHPVISQRAHLHLVGEGPDRAALEAQVARLGLESVVHFHGFQANARDWIAHADFLMLPSLHEGVPYVLLEALSAGTPVVASRVGGIPEVVRESPREAWLVAPKDPSAIVRALRLILSNRILLKEVAQNGRARVASVFSAEAMARRYAALYAGKINR